MPQVPLGGGDLYDQHEQRARERVRGAVIAAPTLAPAEMGEAAKIAKRQATPVGVVAENLGHFKEKERLAAVESAATADPVLGEWLAEPENVALARDEVPALTGLALSMSRLRKLTDPFQAAGAAVPRTVGITATGTSELYGVGVRALDRTLKGVFGPNLPGGDVTREQEQILTPAGFANLVGGKLKGAADAIDVPVERQNLATDIGSGVGQLGTQVVQALLAPQTLVPSLLAQGADMQADRARDTGLHGTEAGDAAILGGAAVTAITEKYGIGKLLDRVPPKVKNAVMRRVADALAGGGIEAAQEVVEGLAQDVLTKVALENDYEIGGGIVREAQAAGGAGAIMRLAVQALNGRRGRQQAQGEREVVDDLVGKALEMPLRQNAPDRFEALVEQSNPGAMVYVPVEDLTTLYQSEEAAGAAMAELIESPTAWAEAVATGGELAIPLSKYVTHLAEQHETLGKKARLQPGQDVRPDTPMPTPEEIQADIAAYMAEARESDARENGPAGQVYDEIYGQLLTKMGEEGARQNASAVQAGYRRMAERLQDAGYQGDAYTLFQRFQVDVAGATSSPAAKSLGSPVSGDALNSVAEAGSQGSPAARDFDSVSGTLLSNARSDGGDLKILRADDLLKNSPPSGGVSASGDVAPPAQPDGVTLGQASPRVAQLIGDEVASEITADNAIEVARAWFNENLRDGDTIRRDGLGDIRVSGKSFREIKRGMRANPDKVRRLPAIRPIIERGRYAGREPLKKARKDGIVAFHRFAGEVEIAGVVKQLEVLVGEDAFGNLLYDVWDKAEAPTFTSGRAEGAGASPDGDAVLLQSFPQEAGDFNVRTLNQPADGGVRRGSVSFGAPDAQGRRVFRIDLSRMDGSTFMHEMGHVWLEMLGDLASDGNVAPGIQADHDTVLRWFGIAGDTPEARRATWAAMPIEQRRPHHEHWAEGFEHYLQTAKAPNTALRRVFAHFKVWITASYNGIKRLDKPVSDDIRSVMERLLATEAEIAEAQSSQHHGALLPEAVGMDLQQYSAYRTAVESARADAEAAVGADVLKEQQRAQKAYNGEQRRLVYAEQLALARELPVYRALRWLRNGKLPDGEPVPMPVKLSKDALLDQYGQSFLRHLTGTYAVEGGMSPDAAAAVLGFGSGSELVQALVNAPRLAEVVKADTDRIMAERYPDPMTDGSLPDRAMRAVHSQRQADVMLREVQALEQHTGGKVRTQAHVLKEVARQLIAAKVARHVQPHTYRQAEAKAGREAFAAASKQDWPAALAARRRQLLNTLLYREAVRAQDDATKIGKRLGGYAKPKARARFGKAGADYLEQIDALLERFDFRTISGKASERRARLSAWIKAKEADGITVDLPEKLVDEAFRKPWKDLTIGEMREIGDAVKQIAHLANLKNRLLSLQDKRTFDEAADGIAASIASHHNVAGEPLDLAMPLHKKVGEALGDADAWLSKVEFMFRWLDGDKANGQLQRTLFQPFVDAERAENVMMDGLSEKLREIFGTYDRGQLAAEKLFIPESVTPRFKGNFTRSSLIAVGLNWGNTANREALMEGYGWTPVQMAAILDKISSQDWDAIEQSWVVIDSLWPEIAQLQRQLTGLTPEKVDAEPFTLPNGRVIRGGYYPLKADSKLSFRAHKREQSQTVQEQFGGAFARAATRKGHTIERTSFGGQPVKLDLAVLTEHISNVVHDLTHRRAVMDANRLIGDSRVREAIEGAAGRSIYRQLNPWLVDIAGAQVKPPTNYIDLIMRKARVGATVVNMGLKVTTAVVQPLGYTQTIHMVGSRHATLALADWTKHPQERTAFAMKHSKVLPDRQRTFDRDVKDTLTRLIDGSRMDDVRRSFFIFTGLMDMSVSIPSWIAGYNKAMAGEVEGIEAGSHADAVSYGDQVIRMSQSSGSVKDLAMIQRGSETQRLFTMFYSYFSVLYNLQRRAVKNIKGLADLPTAAAAAMWLWFVPAVLSEIVAGRGPEEDEEWLDWFKGNAIKFAFYPAQTIPVVRDIINGTDKYGYSPTPAVDAFKATALTLKAGVQVGYSAATDGDREIERADVKNTVLTAGYWGALPARQMWITGEYWHDVATGEEQPESILEFARNSAFTRPQ